MGRKIKMDRTALGTVSTVGRREHTDASAEISIQRASSSRADHATTQEKIQAMETENSRRAETETLKKRAARKRKRLIGQHISIRGAHSVH